jgi:hypothetical protein
VQHLRTISVVRNEEDIIEAFIKHCAAFAETMHVVLHRCFDGTKRILLRLRAEGFPIVCSENNSTHHPQAEVCTRLLHEVAASGADKILFLDADEFLCSDEGSVLSHLEATNTLQPTLIPWRTYVPTPSDDIAELSPIRRIVNRRRQERRQYYKLLVPASLPNLNDCCVSYGSHALLHREGEPIPSARSSTLFLAHFPVRSETQLRRKVLNGWIAHSLRPDKQPGQNWHWERLVARCQNPAPITSAELQDIALRYVSRGGSEPASPEQDPQTLLITDRIGD